MAKPTECMPLKFNGTDVSTSIRCPNSLPERINDILADIEKKRGVRYSRNSFILKALRFYLDHLLASATMNDLLKRLDDVEID